MEHTTRVDESVLWEILREYGINNMEEFEKAFRELKPIDISILASKGEKPIDE